MDNDIYRVRPPESAQGICENDGAVTAVLKRSNYALGLKSIAVNTLVYVCTKCNRVIGIPNVSSGRIAQANLRPVRKSFRVPVELEDLVLAVHMSLGTGSSKGLYLLPIMLGLMTASSEPVPHESWKALDDKTRTLRASFLIQKSTISRINGLAKEWGAKDPSCVFRWLIVAGWEAVTAGLISAAIEARRKNEG